MSHVITVQPRPISSRSGQFVVHQVPAARDNLVWLIEYSLGKCAVVDGPSAKEALAYCSANGLTITTILNTHTHPDHIGINYDIGLNDDCPPVRVFGAAQRRKDIPFLTDPLRDGDAVYLGDVAGVCWLTEGHINGHLCYLFEDFLFSGDTLFAGGCGYLFDGPPKKMHVSLQRLAELPPETKVCCAHEYTQDNLRFAYSIEPNNPHLVERMKRVWQKRRGGESSLPSSIEEELNSNPFLRGHSEEIRDSLRPHYSNVDTVSPAKVFAYTRWHKDSKLYRKKSEPFFLRD